MGPQARLLDQARSLLGAELDVANPETRRGTRHGELLLDLLDRPPGGAQLARKQALFRFHYRQHSDRAGQNRRAGDENRTRIFRVET
jgi:trehalose-6-phosphatase